MPKQTYAKFGTFIRDEIFGSFSTLTIMFGLVGEIPPQGGLPTLISISRNKTSSLGLIFCDISISFCTSGIDFKSMCHNEYLVGYGSQYFVFNNLNFSIGIC